MRRESAAINPRSPHRHAGFDGGEGSLRDFLMAASKAHANHGVCGRRHTHREEQLADQRLEKLFKHCCGFFANPLFSLAVYLKDPFRKQFRKITTICCPGS